MNNVTNGHTKGHVEEARSESTRGGPVFTPYVDIVETDRELLMMADLPGVRSEDVDLQFEKGELILHARVHRRMPETPYVKEYDEGDFYRVFSVHESIDASRIEAQCKNGVLSVKLPKLEAARTRQIKVCTG